MCAIARNGTSAFIGLPEREAVKIEDLWQRDEIGLELSVEVRAAVVIGVYPIRIARFVLENGTGARTNGTGAAAGENDNGSHPLPEPLAEQVVE